MRRVLYYYDRYGRTVTQARRGVLRRNAISFRQSFGDQPFLDEIGHLVAVPVHHDHVGISPDTGVGQIDDIDAATGGLERRRVIDTALADLRPARMVLGVVAVDDEDRRILDRVHLVAVAAQRRLHRDQRLDLVGPRFQHLVAERAGLAVHHDHAGADLVDQRDIGGHDLIVGGEPARDALLHELVVGIDRKLCAWIGRALALVVVPRAGRANAKALPWIALRQRHGLALEGAGPAGAAALHGVGDVAVPTLADEIGEPAVAAVGLGLVGDSREAAAVPQQQRQPALAVLRQEVLHVHLLDLVLAVRVDFRGHAAWREHDLLDWLAGDLDDPASHMERTHVTQADGLLALGMRRCCRQAECRHDHETAHGALPLYC